MITIKISLLYLSRKYNRRKFPNFNIIIQKKYFMLVVSLIYLEIR